MKVFSFFMDFVVLKAFYDVVKYFTAHGVDMRADAGQEASRVAAGLGQHGVVKFFTVRDARDQKTIRLPQSTPR